MPNTQYPYQGRVRGHPVINPLPGNRVWGEFIPIEVRSYVHASSADQYQQNWLTELWTNFENRYVSVCTPGSGWTVPGGVLATTTLTIAIVHDGRILRALECTSWNTPDNTPLTRAERRVVADAIIKRPAGDPAKPRSVAGFQPELNESLTKFVAWTRGLFEVNGKKLDPEATIDESVLKVCTGTGTTLRRGRSLWGESGILFSGAGLRCFFVSALASLVEGTLALLLADAGGGHAGQCAAIPFASLFSPVSRSVTTRLASSHRNAALKLSRYTTMDFELTRSISRSRRGP